MKPGTMSTVVFLSVMMFVSGPVHSGAGGRLSPAAPMRVPPPAKTAPAPSVIIPNVKIPVCGTDAPHTVQRATGTGSPDATTLQVSHSTGAIGDDIFLRAKLVRSKDSAAVSNHTVSFTVAGQPAGSAKTNLQGEAKVQYKVPAQMGLRTIMGHYRGSAFCSGSSGQNSLGVVKSATKFSLKRLNEGSILREGGGDTLQGTLLRITDDQGLDGRGVSLLLDGKPMGSTATDPGGRFQQHFSLPAHSAGPHTIDAKYEGDALYLGSAGKYSFQVLPKIQEAYLTWTGATGKVGQTVTVTARLGLGNPPTAKNAVPGKTIEFRSYRGANQTQYVKVLGSAVTNGQGVATFSFKIEDPANNYKMATQAHISNIHEYKVNYLSDPKYVVGKAPVSISANGPGAAPIGSTVIFTATVRRTTDNGPAAGVEVRLTMDPSDKIGVTATTNENGQATIQIPVPYTYGIGAKKLTFTSSESKYYLGGSGSLAFTVQPKTN